MIFVVFKLWCSGQVWWVQVTNQLPTFLGLVPSKQIIVTRGRNFYHEICWWSLSDGKWEQLYRYHIYHLCNCNQQADYGLALTDHCHKWNWTKSQKPEQKKIINSNILTDLEPVRNKTTFWNCISQQSNKIDCFMIILVILLF